MRVWVRLNREGADDGDGDCRVLQHDDWVCGRVAVDDDVRPVRALDGEAMGPNSRTRTGDPVGLCFGR